jgi:hypothetical protein
MNNFARALFVVTLSIAAHAAPTRDRRQTPTPTQTPQTAQATRTRRADASAEGKAVVFVYRPKKYLDHLLEPSVFCDGVEVARMDNGRYFVLLLEPGEHRVHMTDKSNRVDLRLGAGEAAFIRFRLEPDVWKDVGSVYLADEEDAFRELKKIKPLGADKVKDKTRVVADKSEAAAQLKRFVK